MGIKALGIFSSTVNSKIGKWKKPEITPPSSDHSTKLSTRHKGFGPGDNKKPSSHSNRASEVLSTDGRTCQKDHNVMSTSSFGPFGFEQLDRSESDNLLEVCQTAFKAP